MNSFDASYNEVLFDEIEGQGGHVGVITLNRPAVLNSLNHSMIHAMSDVLKRWGTDAHIKAVVIRAAEGRAFCAGGDLRLTYERAKANDPIAPHFFRDEYHLNSTIYHFPKPYIALLDGITMGGGVGISIHGSHRVATENLMFAMPETGIGFFPDVGGTFFLPGLVSKIGFYLGLTGARLASDDCVSLGIAQHKVAHESLPSLIQAIAQHAFDSNPRASVTQVIEQFQVPIKLSTLLEQQEAIQACFSQPTMEAILQALQHSSSVICHDSIDMLKKKSPASLKITLRAMQEGAYLDFDACMRQEYRLASRFLQGHDFPEGIRAVIIDKDQKPQWYPPTLEQVTTNEIEKYFSPLAEELA
jgi:enoyl-CoA hydratase